MKIANILKDIRPRCADCLWLTRDEAIIWSHEASLTIKGEVCGNVCHASPNPMRLVHDIQTHWCANYSNSQTGESLHRWYNASTSMTEKDIALIKEAARRDLDEISKMAKAAKRKAREEEE